MVTLARGLFKRCAQNAFDLAEVKIYLEVRINKEVRDYQESLFFGLTLRQFICSLLAVAAALGTYFGLWSVLGTGEVCWACPVCAVRIFQLQRHDGRAVPACGIPHRDTVSQAAAVSVQQPICGSDEGILAEGGAKA